MTTTEQLLEPGTDAQRRRLEALRSHLPQPLHSRRLVAWALRITDLAGFMVIYHVLFWVRNGDFTTRLLHSNRWVVVLVAMMGSLYLCDAHRLDRHEQRWRLPARAVLAIVLAGLAIGLSVYLVGPELLGGQYNVLGRSVLIPAVMLFAAYAAAMRLWVRDVVVRRDGQVRWLAIGRRGDEGLSHFWSSFQRQRAAGEVVVLADGPAEPAAGGDAGELPVSGGWADLDAHLDQRWSGVILVGGWALPDAMIERLMRARLLGLRIYDLGDFYERAWEKLPVHHLQRGWFMLTAGFALLHEPGAVRLKRACDLALAAGMLVATAPLLALVYAAVRLDSAGPGLFRQDRVGLGGRVFTCLKFRTMVQGSEAGSMYTAAADRRVTRVGRFLRRSRLDELPQLWNVLVGDMSFIGPRAEWTKCVAEYEHVIPFYQLRHLVKPGITGWAQVNYSYGVSVDDAREKLEYDLYYLKNHSLALDLLIVLRSVKVVLFGRGAR